MNQSKNQNSNIWEMSTKGTFLIIIIKIEHLVYKLLIYKKKNIITLNKVMIIKYDFFVASCFLFSTDIKMKSLAMFTNSKSWVFNNVINFSYSQLLV